MLCFMQNGVIVLPYLSTIRERNQEHLDGNAFNIAALNPAHAIMQKEFPMIKLDDSIFSASKYVNVC